MRLALLFPLALLAACSSEKPADDTLVTLDGADGASPVPAPVVTGPAAAQSGLQAVDAEGSKLEPLLSASISAAGMDSAACKFSPAKGALPVLVASKTGGKGIISVAGRQIDVAPSGAVAATGGSFAAQGVTLMGICIGPGFCRQRRQPAGQRCRWPGVCLSRRVLGLQLRLHRRQSSIGASGLRTLINPLLRIVITGSSFWLNTVRSDLNSPMSGRFLERRFSITRVSQRSVSPG